MAKVSGEPVPARLKKFKRTIRKAPKKRSK